MSTFGFVGAGNMGGALIRGLIRFGAITAGDAYVAGHHPEALCAFSRELGFHVCETVGELIQACDFVLFAVKPYHIEPLIAEHFQALGGKAVLSVIAGYDFERYEALLPKDARHLSIMPNTPSGVGAGVLLFEDRHSLTREEHAFVTNMFAKIGSVVTLPSRLMDAGGAVAGCGPAFIALIMEALADAAVKYGVPRQLAYTLASQMILGTAKMQLETGMHPGQIKDGVCSPSGTTIRGVEALERAGARAAFMSAVSAVMAVKGK